MNINISKSKINFNNILGIAKYTFFSNRIIYLIEGIILGLSIILNLFISRFTRGVDLIPAISIALTVNFFSHLVLFFHQLSKEYGRLLFLTPIKGIELIIGNFLEFFSCGLVIVFVSILCSGAAAGKYPSLLTSATLPILFGLSTSYLILSAIIAVVNSYISKTSIQVLITIFACIVGKSIYGLLAKVILKPLPYAYMSISGFYSAEIDIFSWILGAIAIIALQFLAAYHIDKKLDIV